MCPSYVLACGNRIQKSAGCSHLTCGASGYGASDWRGKGCGTHFCEQCELPLSETGCGSSTCNRPERASKLKVGCLHPVHLFCSLTLLVRVEILLGAGSNGWRIPTLLPATCLARQAARFRSRHCAVLWASRPPARGGHACADECTPPSCTLNDLLQHRGLSPLHMLDVPSPF